MKVWAESKEMESETGERSQLNIINFVSFNNLWESTINWMFEEKYKYEIRSQFYERYEKWITKRMTFN